MPLPLSLPMHRAMARKWRELRCVPSAEPVGDTLPPGH